MWELFIMLKCALWCHWSRSMIHHHGIKIKHGEINSNVMVCITKQEETSLWRVEGKRPSISTSAFQPKATWRSHISCGTLIRQIKYLPNDIHFISNKVLHDGEQSIVCDSTVALFVARHLDVSFVPEANPPTAAQKVNTIWLIPYKEHMYTNTSSQRSPVLH